MTLSCDIVRVDALDCRVQQRPWNFAIERAGEIDAHWARVTAAKPALYNGQVLLQHTGRMSDAAGRRVFVGEYLQTEFKAFMAWRDFGRPEAGVRNCFSLAALRSADGAFIVGEMGAHTASAGRCYFPAGTPDPTDVRDGTLDLDASARRELQEETGLAPAELQFAAGWDLIIEPTSIACMKPTQATVPADELAARIEAFLRADPQPELARVHVVRNMADAERLDMPTFMRPYLAEAFARDQPLG